jgi:DNA-binding Lrp family transcriptional regulator
MVRENHNCNTEPFQKRLLDYLVEDPTRSVRQTSEDLHANRQRVWRQKRAMEEDNVIWGYSAVVDEVKLGRVLYLVMMKLRPMDRDLVALITERLRTGAPHKQDIQLVNLLYVNGEYDLIAMFSAPDHVTARRYYDSLRVSYDGFLLAKPVIVDVNFILIRNGKMNPELSRLEDFIPI